MDLNDANFRSFLVIEKIDKYIPPTRETRAKANYFAENSHPVTVKYSRPEQSARQEETPR